MLTDARDVVEESRVRATEHHDVDNQRQRRAHRLRAARETKDVALGLYSFDPMHEQSELDGV